MCIRDSTYTVSIDTAASATALAGLAPTLANQGGDTAVDSSTGSATSVPMTTDGQKDLTLDFGFYDAPVSVGDYVWWDANRDGLQSANELPVPGVKVDLLDATGAPTGRTTTTDGQGYYWFNNLVAGQNYILKFTAPDGSTWTTQNASNDTSNDPATDKTDSDVNPANGQIAFTAPASGSNATGANVADNPTLDGGLVKYNLTPVSYTHLDVYKRQHAVSLGVQRVDDPAARPGLAQPGRRHQDPEPVPG